MPKVGMKPIRQAQLIEATLVSVARLGLHGTTVNSISKIAGVSAGVISHYFGGKQELLEATVRFLLQSLQDELFARLNEVTKQDPLARLDAIIDANFCQFQIDDDSAKTWMAFWSQAMHEPELARLQRVNERRLHSNLKYSLRPLLDADQVDDAAESIAAMIDGLWLRGALSEKTLDGQHAADLCKRFLRALL
ncbi:transcriptional regulator BetI [Litoribrevibacter albus]|uniref:HTH-type transcriptional regulator BetI n=1 Tax=Litoribrevibacter albus TaxID=1473156 RepID=A0AA37SBD5_9GAMM|nr:transcriptional regulator BetI [Litoribrevibacter albus]GLQ32191.1 HTH-type transcriptional regulator BetI [Litoribrevibacter albus]